MIVSWSDEQARALLEDDRRPRRAGWGNVHRIVRRKLQMLDAAHVLEDLKIPPGNRLEALRGDRAGQHSIRVNDQWRVCFVWTEDGPAQVEVTDYH
jgi:toxin HigB-1